MQSIIIKPGSWSEGEFTSQHHACTRTGDGKEHIILKGTIAPRFLQRTPQTPSEIFKLILEIPLDPVLPQKQFFQIEQWAPQVVLNGMSLTNISEAFGIEIKWTKLRNLPQTPTDKIQIETEIHLKNENSKIHQLNYHIDLIGVYVGKPP